MIKFEQVGDGTPKDIQVTTDDGDAELAKFNDVFLEAGADDTQSYLNLDAAEAVDGVVTFVIPGDEVGEVADLMEDEIPELWAFLQEANERAIEEAKSSE